MKKYVIGVDYGTDSARAVVIDRRYEDPVVNDYWLSLQCMKSLTVSLLRQIRKLQSIRASLQNLMRQRFRLPRKRKRL